MDLSVDIGSLGLKNPLIAASGCFGYGLEYADVVDLASLGGIAVKGLFLAEREGHELPRIVETPAGMLNAIGLQGIGVHRFVREKLPALRACGATTIVNICGSSIEEYAEIARVLSDAEGVSAIELNISCPNIKEGGITFGCSAAGTRDVVRAVRAVTPLPIMPKLTPNVTDIGGIAVAAEDAGADAGIAGQYVPRHGDRRGDPTAEALQRRGRPERTGHSPHRRAHGLRVPPGGEHSDRRHGRHHDGDRRPWNS